MSSQEIAKLTGKQHKDVLHDIRNMLKELGKRSAVFSADLLDSYGRSQPGFMLPKRETLILVSGYSIAMRAKIIDRWQELERQATGVAGQPQFAIPQTLHEALQLASNLEKERSVAVEKLAISDEKLAVSDAKLAIAEPKAEALDVIANTEGLLGLQETGRVLDQPPNLFVKWLRDEVGGWIYQRSRLSTKKREVVAGAVEPFISSDNGLTMSSLEMVEFINSQRKKGEAVLRHDNFMAKVPKVLGNLAPKFLGTSYYINGAGNKVPCSCYYFPKREACLMALSYSFALQAKVFDRMTALLLF